MKLESKRAARGGVRNMASTGRLKNVEYENDWARKRAEIVNLLKGARRKKRDASALGVLALLASLDAERLKLTAEIFTAMHPFAPAQDVALAQRAGGDWELKRAKMMALLFPKMPARVFAALVATAGRLTAAELEKGEAELKNCKVQPRRRRRRKRLNNLVLLKPNLSAPKGDDSPKAS